MKTNRFKQDDEGKRVGIWIRVSTEQQAMGESPEHHEHRARAYADFKGWTVVKVYHLEGVSGKSVMQHPETRKMLEDVKSGAVTGLIFSKLARLARSTKELLEFAEIFKTHDADLISLGESIDTSTPAGVLFYTMIAAMGQWEREEIASRVAASVPIRAKLGKSLGGSAPLGYQWKDNQLIPDPKEAPLRRLMYELLEQNGYRLKTVVKLLNEQGYRTRKGYLFSPTTVRRLVLDPTARGVRRANYIKHLGDGKHWGLKPESEWVFTPIEPIVSEELWERCANHLTGNRRQVKRPSKRVVHLFAGVLFCACGQKMYVPSNSEKYVCRSCRNKIAPDGLEKTFATKLQDFFLSENDVAEHLEQADENLKQRAELLETLKAEQNSLTAEMKKTYRLHMDDKISSDAFSKLYSPLEERSNQLEEEIPHLEGEIDFLKMRLNAREEVIADARDLYNRFPTFPLERKRSIVETLTERIIVSENDLRIELCYLPNTSPQAVAKGELTYMGSP